MSEKIQKLKKLFSIVVIFAILIQMVIMNFTVVVGESNNQSEDSNTPSARSQPRGARSLNLFTDNFDTGSWDSSKWSRSSSSYVGINSDTSNSGSYSMYLKGGVCNAVTFNSYDTSSYGKITVGFWVREGDSSYSEQPDSGEDLIAEYYSSSSSWVQIDRFYGGDTSGGWIYDEEYNLTGTALHSSFKLRFRHTGASNTNYDWWHIDDVYIRITDYVMDLSPLTNLSYGRYNSQVDYTFKINNVGSKDDTYDLTSISNWTTKFRDINDNVDITSITISKDTWNLFIARVIIPDSSTSYTMDTAIVKVSSQNSALIKKTAVLTTMVTHPVPWEDDFEGGKIGKYWTVFSTGGKSDASTHTSNSGRYSMYTNGGHVSVTTTAFDTRTVEDLEVAFWLQRGGVFSEVPDSGEDIIVEYLNKNDIWVTLDAFSGGGTPGQIFDESYKLSVDAIHNHFRLKFSLIGGSGTTVDYWHVDDVYIGPLRVTLLVQPEDVAPEEVLQDEKNVEMLKISMTARKSDVNLSALTVNLTGTGNDLDISEARLILDIDISGNYTKADTILCSTKCNNTRIKFLRNWTIPSDATRVFFLIFNISKTAEVGRTLGIKISANEVELAKSATLSLLTEFQTKNSTILETPDHLSITAQNKAPAQVEQGQSDIYMMIIHLLTLSRFAVLKSLTLDLTGTGEASDIDKVRLYYDNNSNGKFDKDDDQFIKNGTIDLQAIIFTNLSFMVNESHPKRLLIILDLSPDAIVGKSIGLKLRTGSIIVNDPDKVIHFGSYQGGPLKIEPKKDVTPPGRPLWLKIISTTLDSISLVWNPNPEEDLVGYNIYRREGGEPENWGSPIGTTTIGEERFTDTGLKDDTTYFYVVTSFDEVPNESNFSNVVNGTTKLGPRAPIVQNPMLDVTIIEDSIDKDSIKLYDWFIDRNGDPMKFRCEGNKNMNVTIFQNNGSVIIIPDHNWNGQEILTFFASDGDSENFDLVRIIVLPLNDAPGPAVIVSPEYNTTIKDDESVNFICSCDDPDLPYGDILDFKWSTSEGKLLGQGESLMSIFLPIGEHTIIVEVTDSYSLSSSAEVNITVVKNLGKIPDDTDQTSTSTKSTEGELDVTNLVIFIVLIIAVVIIGVSIGIIYKKNKKKREEYERAQYAALARQQVPASEVQPQAAAVGLGTSSYSEQSQQQIHPIEPVYTPTTLYTPPDGYHGAEIAESYQLKNNQTFYK